MFSTIAEIREDAGITNNTNISDATVQTYQREANSWVLSTIAARYRLDSVLTLSSGDPGYDVLNSIERLIATGLLLNKEFPGDETDEESKGNKKIDRGDAKLDSIVAGTMRLLFSDNTEVAQLGTDGVWGKSRLVTDNFTCRDVPEDVKW